MGTRKRRNCWICHNVQQSQFLQCFWSKTRLICFVVSHSWCDFPHMKMFHGEVGIQFLCFYFIPNLFNALTPFSQGFHPNSFFSPFCSKWLFSWRKAALWLLSNWILMLLCCWTRAWRGRTRAETRNWAQNHICRVLQNKRFLRFHWTWQYPSGSAGLLSFSGAGNWLQWKNKLWRFQPRYLSAEPKVQNTHGIPWFSMGSSCIWLFGVLLKLQGFGSTMFLLLFSFFERNGKKRLHWIFAEIFL